MSSIDQPVPLPLLRVVRDHRGERHVIAFVRCRCGSDAKPPTVIALFADCDVCGERTDLTTWIFADA